MKNTSFLTAALGFAAISKAHMIMNTPVPYGKSTLNNSPLDASGSDFPCKQRTGVYEAEGASNSMALGSSQPLSFTGSATHGGGSCQISITYDQAPTKSSTFKVIHSIEGGCPIKGVAGNNGDNANAVDPDTYSFTIPSSLPTGDATLAWTWFNKVGNREMYMNCAPVTITGSSSKRSEDDDLMLRNVTQLMERDTAAFDALPDMFVANIGNGCTSVDSADLKFPAPGDSLELDGASTATPIAPTGTGCGSTLAGSAATTVGSGSGATSPAPVATSAAAVTSKPALSGGVFASVATSAGNSPSSTSAPVAASSVAATPVVASNPAATVASSAAAPASTETTGTGSAIAAGTACTTEGMWNCVGGTSFQQCASGTWSVVQSVAAGTTCTSGETMALNVAAVVVGKPKRAIRFSSQHVRRHLQHAS